MRSNAGGTAITEHESIPKQRLFVLLWSFLTLIWSIFTPPHRTFAVRVLLFQPVWGVRMWIGEHSWGQDLALSLSLHAIYSWFVGSWRIWQLSDFYWADINHREFWIYLQVFSLLGVCGAFAGGIVHRGYQLKTPQHNGQPKKHTIDEQLLPPLLMPSRTTHSRIFPRKHSFSYSYLFVGIPVGLSGRLSNALSVDSQDPAWFDIRSADYLDRGRAQLMLGEKLKRYLHTQGVTDRDYSSAYMVTAPRFLGYGFNPVSFWYLYDSDAKLKYMILEVNNTFDERRIYLLHSQQPKLEDELNGKALTAIPQQLVFTDTFDKDFHVSPFNSRKGSYSIRAVDPLAAYEETGKVRIDNTIVLRSTKESAKIVARVYSEGQSRDATSIRTSELIRFVVSWWWVGFLTFPRIVWEARKLFFKRKLHVWYRPEVAVSSIGRNYTSDETVLETHFRDFLQDAVAHAEKPLRVIYEPAHAESEEVVMYSRGFTYEEDQTKTMAIRITSPAFYSRFVHYAHAREAFDRECLATDEKNRTLTITNPQSLAVLFDSLQKSAQESAPRKQSPLKKLRWSLLRWLRRPPPAASYPDTPGYSVSDIRSFGSAEIDSFVQMQSTEAGTYQRIVIKIFLASRFAVGLPVLISGLDLLLRGCLVLATLHYSHHATAVDIFRPRRIESQDLRNTAIVFLLAHIVHIWSFIKG